MMRSKQRAVIFGLLSLAIIILLIRSIGRDTTLKGPSCELSLEDTGSSNQDLGYRSPECESYYLCPLRPGVGLQQYLPSRLIPATINRDCFRGALPEPTEDLFRIAFIGDSFTFGLGVADNETFPFFVGETLEQTLSCPVQSLNLAVPGYSLHDKLKSLEEKAVHYNPDVVIFQLFWDDWYQNDEAQKFIPPIYWFARLLASESCMRCNVLSETLFSFNARLYWRMHPYTASALKVKLASTWDELFVTAGQLNASLVLLDLGAGTVLESVPERWSSSPDFHLIPYFPEWETEENIIQGDGHPNPSGHRIIADEVVSYLLESGLAECKNRGLGQQP